MPRLKSIDILRALTMLLMIFVNDLWSLSDIPGWLEHKAASEDGMGLADVVFPAFLFIVGLSVPHAIRARFKKGDNKLQVFKHIVERSLALLIMGVFMVNLESIDREAMMISKPVFQILMTLAFFLIWNVYRGKAFGRISPIIMKSAGWLLLLFLAIIYKAPDHGAGTWMHFHWWGILGLIGWAYLISASIYLLIGNKPWWIFAALILLYLMNINEFITPFSFTFKIVVSASNYALVLGGVLTTTVMIQLKEQNKFNKMIPLLLAFAILCLLSGFLTRPIWGISKIMATPSWTAICTGITALAFGVMYLLTDKFGIYRWANFISAAGTSTLTCYLVPYFVYGLWVIIGLTPIVFLNTGFVGIIKSIIFSILIIQITGLLGKWNIKLKI